MHCAPLPSQQWELLTWTVPWGGVDFWEVRHLPRSGLERGDTRAAAPAAARPYRSPLPARARSMKIVSSLMRGDRLPVPPREHLPGPDTLRFTGLDAYVALMQRCWAQVRGESGCLPAAAGVWWGAECTRCLLLTTSSSPP